MNKKWHINNILLVLHCPCKLFSLFLCYVGCLEHAEMLEKPLVCSNQSLEIPICLGIYAPVLQETWQLPFSEREHHHSHTCARMHLRLCSNTSLWSAKPELHCTLGRHWQLIASVLVFHQLKAQESGVDLLHRWALLALVTLATE